MQAGGCGSLAGLVGGDSGESNGQEVGPAGFVVSG